MIRCQHGGHVRPHHRGALRQARDGISRRRSSPNRPAILWTVSVVNMPRAAERQASLVPNFLPASAIPCSILVHGEIESRSPPVEAPGPDRSWVPHAAAASRAISSAVAQAPLARAGVGHPGADHHRADTVARRATAIEHYRRGTNQILGEHARG